MWAEPTVSVRRLSGSADQARPLSEANTSLRREEARGKRTLPKERSEGEKECVIFILKGLNGLFQRPLQGQTESVFRVSSACWAKLDAILF